MNHMSKNVVIISSSPRRDGNSETLARQFFQGAVDAGHEVNFFCLRDLDLGYCKACYACAKTGKCCQKDQMNEIAPFLLAADVIVFATPVYFYTMSGQMKVFVDRLVPWYTQIHADIYLMCTAADEDKKLLKLTIESLRGCTRDCLEQCTEKGVIIAGGVYEKGEIAGRPELKKAYKMGRNC